MSDLPQGEIRLLRHETDGGAYLTVDYADPVVWFAKHTLEMMLEEPDPDPGWSFDGSLVTLEVANGKWVWKLTGRSWCHEYGPGTTPLVMLEGIWPD